MNDHGYYQPSFTEGAIQDHLTEGEDSITSPVVFVRSLKVKIPPGFNTEHIIFCYSKEILKRLVNTADRDWLGRQKKITINIGELNTNPITLVQKDGGKSSFAICHPQAGAANIAILAEELYAAGFENFLSIGPGGHIYGERPTLEIGDLVIAEEAFPYDATAPHYRADDAARYFNFVRSLGKLEPSQRQLSMLESSAAYAGVPVKKAKVATTGALYRENAAFANEVLSRGVEVLDMETSGLYAALKDKEYANFASVLYIVDQVSVGLDKNKWDVFFKSPKFYFTHKLGARLCLETMILDVNSFWDRVDPLHPYTFCKRHKD
jgi:purine-nucleoside phosphorylase